LFSIYFDLGQEVDLKKGIVNYEPTNKLIW